MNPEHAFPHGGQQTQSQAMFLLFVGRNSVVQLGRGFFMEDGRLHGCFSRSRANTVSAGSPRASPRSI
jgi:hypothetical protein